MMVWIKAARDSDGVVLGKMVADITNRQATKVAISELLNAIYEVVPDPLNIPPLTFKLDTVENSN